MNRGSPNTLLETASLDHHPHEDAPHVTISRIGLTNIRRRLCRLAVIVPMLLCMGCASGRLPLPFGRHSSDQALRKQVETDSFPTAKQAGL